MSAMGSGSGIFEKAQSRPFTATITAVLLLLFVLDLSSRIKIDGWAIALLVMAVIPWCFPALLSGLRSFGAAFGETNLRSIEIGALKIESLEKKVSEQNQKIDEQRRILDDLVLYSMAYYIYDKLRYLYFGTNDAYRSQFGEYIYHRDEAFDHDLRYLRDHGYLEMFQLAELDPGANLVGRLKVTEMGRRFVELKEARFREGVTPP